MALSVWFWVLTMLWVLLSGASVAGWSSRYGVWGNSLLLVLIVLVLGYQVFGSPVR